jgi:hypothetical protein
VCNARYEKSIAIRWEVGNSCPISGKVNRSLKERSLERKDQAGG